MSIFRLSQAGDMSHDERMGLALETLREVARVRQVILFTCQDREEAYLDAQMR